MRKLVLAALLAIGGYGLYKSRQPPKKKKKSGPTIGTAPSPEPPPREPTPTEPDDHVPSVPKGELIYIDNFEDAQAIFPLIAGQPIIMVGSVAPGSVRDALLPAMQELAPQYPTIFSLFFDLSGVEQSMTGQPLRSNVAQAMAGIVGNDEEGACVRVIGGPPGFQQELQANQETAVFKATPFSCVYADVRQMDDVIAALVTAAEMAAGMVPQDPGRTIRANPGRSILEMF